MLTKSGTKLLDFGLAKTTRPVVGIDGTMVPPPNLTAQGNILGTVQYMAPEQIEGLEADARTDIFAFGCVLFELLTGTEAFEGKTHASLIGAILKDEPPAVSQLQPLAPVAIDRVVATCLAKDPDDRWQTARELMRELKWVDGKTSALRAREADWAYPRFSPDGQKLALQIYDGRQWDIWVYEWARETLTQVTFDPGDDRIPVWTPDGRRIVFESDRAKPGIQNLYWVSADGTGEVTRLTDSNEHQFAHSAHPSGQFLAFSVNRSSQSDLMILPMEGDGVRRWTPGKPMVFLTKPGVVYAYPTFSPDGRWIAYFSNETGTPDIYVRPFPGPGGKWRVSTEGGTFPVWSATAHELLFVEPVQNRIMVAPYAVVGDSFRVDKAHVWSPTRLTLRASSTDSPYDLHPDGKRLVTTPPPEGRVQDKVVFVFNFADYLRKIAPASK